MNPLLRPSSHPNKVPDFTAIQEKDYLPAIEDALKGARADIAAIRDNPSPPDFANTIVALETAGEAFGHVVGLYYTMLHIAGTDGLQSLSDTIGTLSAAFGSEVSSDKALFTRVAAVYRTRDTLNLSPEDATLLDNTYHGFIRGGVNLPAAKQARLKTMNEKLAVMPSQFNHNQAKAIEGYSLWLTDEASLAGLPPTLVGMAKAAATEKGRPDSWLITLDMPFYVPFMRNSTRRDLREALWRDMCTLCQDKPFDNRKLVLDMVKLRDKRAKLLGYATHADYVLEDRMAKTPAAVHDFLHGLMDTYFVHAKRDLQTMRDFAKTKLGIDDLQPWDVLYVREKLGAATFDLDNEQLRPYFKLEQVLEGTFTHFSKLFGIRFVANPKTPTWHKDVVAYDVLDDKTGAFLSTFFADFFPRAGKKPGAWHSSLRRQGLYQGHVERPISAIICNFTPSTPDHPSLLTFEEVQTLFHEMGHATHVILTQGTYPSLTGTSVEWDFVELPSQLQENWCTTPETLALIGRHYQTGDALPADMVNKLIRAKNFMVAWDGLNQVKYALLDLTWHTADPATIKDIGTFESSLLDAYRLFPKYPGLISTTFGHVFGGGYDVGYYSYKWAEVLEADAFEAFVEHGLYDQQTAASYRMRILEKGGSEPPGELYRAFRGRDADPKALIRREGLAA